MREFGAIGYLGERDQSYAKFPALKNNSLRAKNFPALSSREFDRKPRFPVVFETDFRKKRLNRRNSLLFSL